MSKRTLYGILGAVFMLVGILAGAVYQSDLRSSLIGGLIGIGSAYLARALMWID